MQAGKLDRRITLQRRVVSRSGSGEEIETYQDIADVWAQKLEGRGDERYLSQQSVANIAMRWRIRWRDDLTVLHRLIHGGVEHDIVHIAEIGRRAGLELFTSARVP